MKNTLKHIAYIVISLSALKMFILSPSRCCREQIEIKSDTIVVRDTVVKPTTCYVSTHQVDTVILSHFDTTIIHDTVFVFVPISHHHYHYPDTADIWISGYNAKIDSAVFNFKTVIKTEYVPRYEQKAFEFGIEAGLGANLYEDRLVPELRLDAVLNIRRHSKLKLGFGTNYYGGMKPFAHCGISVIIK